MIKSCSRKASNNSSVEGGLKRSWQQEYEQKTQERNCQSGFVVKWKKESNADLALK